MPERMPADSVNDILLSIEHVRDFSSKLSIDEFSAEAMRVEACLYNIYIIGTAVSNLPENLKNENPQIPWALLEETKAKLVHDHIGTDIQLLWNYIKFELPSLVKKFTKLHEELSTTGI